MAASLSRSLIMENVGGRTQASGIITSSILLVVLLWLGPVFEVLPKVRSCFRDFFGMLSEMSLGLLELDGISQSVTRALRGRN